MSCWVQQHVCYVCFKEEQSAQMAIEYVATTGMWLGGRKLSTKYATIARPPMPPPEPECTSSTDEIEVPGLTVIRDFVTEADELHLLQMCDIHENKKSKWKSNLSRRVQVILI